MAEPKSKTAKPKSAVQKPQGSKRGSDEAIGVQWIDSAIENWQSELPDIDTYSFQLVSLITMMGVQVESEFRAYSQSAFDMGTGDLRVLLSLRRALPNYSRTPVQLEKSLLVTSGAITKQIYRLEARGLVERQRHSDGKRGWMIHLTPKGADLLKPMLSGGNPAYPTMAAAFYSLPEEEQEAGLRFLRRLMGKLQARRAFDRPLIP